MAIYEYLLGYLILTWGPEIYVNVNYWLEKTFEILKGFVGIQIAIWGQIGLVLLVC